MGDKEEEGGRGEQMCFQAVHHMVQLVRGATFLHSPPLNRECNRTQRWQENEESNLGIEKD